MANCTVPKEGLVEEFKECVQTYSMNVQSFLSHKRHGLSEPRGRTCSMAPAAEAGGEVSLEGAHKCSSSH